MGEEHEHLLDRKVSMLFVIISLVRVLPMLLLAGSAGVA